MNAYAGWHDPVLINTIGHTAGVLLFGVFIALLVLDWRIRSMRQVRLSLIAAALALGWNAGSLIVLASPDSRWIDLVAMASFSMLSLLPAVLLQVAVRGRQHVIVATGYVVSTCAAALHFAELFSSGAGLHQAGLLLVVFGFAVLAFAAFLCGLRRDAPAEKPDWISPACLLLFTTSFLHFGYQHAASPWTAEIAWHHIGIPVALIVLLRDYRFLLLDTFIRFLVNAGLAAVYVAALLVLDWKFQLSDLLRRSMFLTGIALVALCLSLILFTYLRNRLQAWVSGAIFRRQSLDRRLNEMGKLAFSATSDEELLAQLARHVADHFQADRFAILKHPGEREAPVRPSVVFRDSDASGMPKEGFRAEARIPLRFSSGDARYLLVGARRGGRRYWSDDLEDMRRLGAAIVEQVERFRAEELKRLASQAELRALQAQINPHFLFNALNTLYGSIDRRSREARQMVLNLAEIFRYSLQSHDNLIPLSEEIRIVKAYLEIEGLRLGDRLETDVIMAETAKDVSIPILSIQPLVENAVKHGIAAKQGVGRVCVKTEVVASGLRVIIQDTGIGFERSRALSHNGTGLGLENVRRRLALCYGPKAELQIQSSDAGTTVSFLVPAFPLARTAAHSSKETACGAELAVKR